MVRAVGVSPVITADDRTGAFEAAAQCADAGLVVSLIGAGAGWWPDVDAGSQVTANQVTAVDLGSRHLTAAEAADRVGRVCGSLGERLVVHKIDSTLRGNWGAEIGALLMSGRRVLLVPAFPAAGRTCQDGIVLEHGVPVDRTAHGSDPRSPSVTSRPASILTGAVELAGTHAVRRWCTSGDAVGVADASTDDDLDTIVAVLGDAGADVVLVGTAAVAGAWARRHAAAIGATGPGAVARPYDLDAPVVVVSGSAHPTALRQVARLADRGVPSAVPGGEGALPAGAPVVVITAPPLAAGAADHADMAAALGRAARATVARLGAATVVVIGGDTAEAVVGERPVRVHGSLGVGIACGTVELDGRSITIVTKPGGFGDPGTVEALMRALPASPPDPNRDVGGGRP